jgi:fatty acid desaturase
LWEQLSDPRSGRTLPSCSDDRQRTPELGHNLDMPTLGGARDYSLIGPSGAEAEAMGLVAAEWYHADIPRKRMKQLMRRSDGPALRDTALWFVLLAGFAVAAGLAWPSPWSIPLFLVYGVLYGSASDSRWHEAGHGTAFRTSWLNDALYQLASFMNIKEPTFWETAEEATFIPECERPKVYREARAWLTVYALAIVLESPLLLLYVGLPSLYGRWLSVLFGVSQHAGLAENVLDHRLNARTIHMKPVSRFLYWNMNFHVEHHMFPMVPYHALPALHAEVRDELPVPYQSLFAAYREILPTLLRQMRDPTYFVNARTAARTLPTGSSWATSSSVPSTTGVLTIAPVRPCVCLVWCHS